MFPDIPRDRWERADAIFTRAIELDAAERELFIAKECGSDDEVRALVRRLLDADELSADRIGDSATGFAAPLLNELTFSEADSDESLAAGERIGAYRIVSELGRGGMGTVYLAERADGTFEQRVALKLVKRSMITEDVLQRFRQERQILASLEHPGIARLIDGGVSPDGRPYFVMELVNGEPVDKYCDRMRLGIRERLLLIQRICDAVQYAHRRLVVHRDLKPSNILISEDGSPRLLDFGVARPLEQLAETDAAQSRAPQMLTPDYAAPEQLRGEAATTAMDVYALGVVLYRLLTGRKPFHGRSVSVTRGAPALTDEQPPKPSSIIGSEDGVETGELAKLRSTTPARLARQLDGDLDAILLKALAVTKEERYGSVEEFSADIRRYLGGFPVIARPPTRWYRSGKFVRRHAVAVAAASVLVLMLSGFTVALRIQQSSTARQRDRAELERDKAEQVVQFITGMLGAADPAEARGDTLDVFELLARSEKHVDTALAKQPEVRAELLHVMGGLYRNLGDYTRARSRLSQALHMRRRILGPMHPDVAESAADLADVSTTMSLYSDAELLYTEALAIRRAAFGEYSTPVAMTLHGLGELQYWKGDHGQAAATLARADSVHRRSGSDPVLVAANLTDFAEALRAQNKLQEAEPLLREGLRIRRERLGADHPLTASSMSVLANLLRDRGEVAAAEPLYREALGVRRRILGEEHPDYAKSLIGLAYNLERQKKYAEAEPLFRQALAINTRKHGSEHPEVGLGMNALAMVLAARGATAEAERLYRSALQVLNNTLGPGHPRVSMPLVGLGTLLATTGRANDGVPLLRQALQLRLDEFGQSHRLTAEARQALGDALVRLGRRAEAEPLLGQVSARR